MAVNEPSSPPDPARGPAGAALPEPSPAAAAALDRAAAELASSTDRGPSPGLLPAVMHTVWAELRPGQHIPLPSSGGALFVTETAASNALVADIDGLAGMTVRRCAVLPDAAAPSGEGAGIRIALTAAVAYGTDTGALFAQARSIIRDSALSLFGLTVGGVDIEIVDIYSTAEHRR